MSLLKNTNILAIVIALLSTLNVYATGGGVSIGGGGDTCDNQIEIVRDDIKSWIQQGGAKELTLPSAVSYDYYVNGMLDMINRSHLSCTTNPIVVAGAEKTCVNNFDQNGLPFIVCNRNLIQRMSVDDLYVLTHHEYASLARVENNVGADSDYAVSNQISGYLVIVLTKKLAVKKPHLASTGYKNSVKPMCFDQKTQTLYPCLKNDYLSTINFVCLTKSDKYTPHDIWTEQTNAIQDILHSRSMHSPNNTDIVIADSLYGNKATTDIDNIILRDCSKFNLNYTGYKNLSEASDKVFCSANTVTGIKKCSDALDFQKNALCINANNINSAHKIIDTYLGDSIVFSQVINSNKNPPLNGPQIEVTFKETSGGGATLIRQLPICD